MPKISVHGGPTNAAADAEEAERLAANAGRADSPTPGDVAMPAAEGEPATGLPDGTGPDDDKGSGPAEPVTESESDDDDDESDDAESEDDGDRSKDDDPKADRTPASAVTSGDKPPVSRTTTTRAGASRSASRTTK